MNTLAEGFAAAKTLWNNGKSWSKTEPAVRDQIARNLPFIAGAMNIATEFYLVASSELSQFADDGEIFDFWLLWKGWSRKRRMKKLEDIARANEIRQGKVVLAATDYAL